MKCCSDHSTCRYGELERKSFFLYWDGVIPYFFRKRKFMCIALAKPVPEAISLILTPERARRFSTFAKRFSKMYCETLLWICLRKSLSSVLKLMDASAAMLFRFKSGSYNLDSTKVRIFKKFSGSSFSLKDVRNISRSSVISPRRCTCSSSKSVRQNSSCNY